jgi:hypothetical protein
MMDPTLQLITDQLNKLDNVCAGQDKMEDSMSAIKGEIKNDISGIQGRISIDISATRSCQEEFEMKMRNKLDKQLKGIVTVVEQ